MNNRDFSDSIKLEVIKTNLEKNGGKICCEVCGNALSSIKESHFDHIYPYAKGGKSTLENCQLLCAECNLKKNDKELKDFILEEKAKSFLNGFSLSEVESADSDDVDIETQESSVAMTNTIPQIKELAKLGLPSRDVILKYYEDWKEPFYIYKKLYEELNRH